MCASVRLGARISAACLAEGFSRRAYQAWLRKGLRALRTLRKDPKAKLTPKQELFYEFVVAWRKAEGQLQAEKEQEFAERAANDAESLYLWLTTRMTEDWQPPSKGRQNTTAGPGGGPDAATAGGPEPGGRVGHPPLVIVRGLDRVLPPETAVPEVTPDVRPEG